MGAPSLIVTLFDGSLFVVVLLCRIMAGLIVFDNVLWKDRAAAVRSGLHSPKEKIAIAMDKFNAHVASDPRTVQVCLPLDDGLLICRRA
jgi:predicted O-methyltransferase YrrM